MTIDYGPQHAGDQPFTARIRFHQSWYRATVLGVGYGTGPQPHHRCRFGNMLDAEAGAEGAELPHARDPSTWRAVASRWVPAWSHFDASATCSRASRCASTCSGRSCTTTRLRRG